MPRPSRINHAGLVYHVVNRGNNRQILFAEEEDYRHYLGILVRYKVKYDFSVFAYCLMSNHVHLVIKTGEDGCISRIMQAVTIAYTRYYQKNYHVSGHVWQGRFKSPLVSDDEYLLTVMRYIEQNPVRAGIVRNPGEYLFSSYRAHVTMCEEDVVVDRIKNPVFLSFGNTLEERIGRYKEYVGRMIEEDKLGQIRMSLQGRGHFVSERFQAQMEQMLRIKRRGRGRPRRVINS